MTDHLLYLLSNRCDLNSIVLDSSNRVYAPWHVGFMCKKRIIRHLGHEVLRQYNSCILFNVQEKEYDSCALWLNEHLIIIFCRGWLLLWTFTYIEMYICLGKFDVCTVLLGSNTLSICMSSL